MNEQHFMRFTTHYTTKLILPMHRRLSLVFLPLLYAPNSFASDAAWNCEQSKDTKEWLCVGDKKPAATADESPALVPVEKMQPTTVAKPYTPYPVPSKTVPPAVPATVKRPTFNDVPVSNNKVFQAPPLPPATVQRAKPIDAPVVQKEMPQPLPMPAPAPRAKPNDLPVAERPIVIPTQDNQAAAPENDASSASSLPIRLPGPSNADNKKSSNVANKSEGWNCDGENQEGNWDCQLLGADPKGQAHAVKVVASGNKESNTNLHLIDPAFDTNQEQTFETLRSQLPYDPWENCATQQKIPHNFVPKKGLRDTAPMELTSDFSETFDNEIGNYLGNVEIKRADQHSLSHIANYDSVSQTLDLNGDVFYNEDELALYGRSASLKLATDQTKLRDALFISPATHLRGSSKVVYRDSKTFSRYKDVAYTSCQPGNQDWVLHAEQLKKNDVEGKGAVKNAWLEFKGVPVFYTPYLSFATDNRRITGFLPPSFHFTKQAGFGLYTPYYWNIAPNYDVTFTPRYLSKRGVLLDGNFRYLTEMTKGAVKFEYMPNDSQLNKARYLGEITNSTVYTPHLSSNLDLNYVSDKDYFAQLGNVLSLPNFSYVRSSADVNYNREGVAFSARADNYQSVDPNITVLPYRRLPQINLSLFHSFKSVLPVDARIDSESVNFQHSTYVNAQRFNIKPYVSVPWQNASAFVTPKASFQYTQYLLANPSSTGSSTSVSRTLPILSVDSGLFFEKNLNLAGTSMLHTLEPRLFYLYIPYKDQSQIPVFDSAQYDFVFNSLFRENLFAGTDRIQNANQVSLALTSRLVDSSTGREKLKLNLGETFYFKDRNVTLSSTYGVNPYSFVDTNWSSPIVAELNSELTDHVSVETGLQWDPHGSGITRGKGAIHFVNQPNEIINAGYYYRRNSLIPDRLDDIVQSDVSFHWPIYDDWSVVGRWQYSLLYNKTQEGFFGLEKENCCWRFRIIGRQYINSFVTNSPFLAVGVNQLVAQATPQTGIFFQIELKGLTGIGDQLDSFFERNIYGYRRSQQ
jgi:LPS-assembly protein